jgi:hypothetical protein
MLLEVGPAPPAPFVAPLMPCVVCTPQAVEPVALPAVKDGFDPLLKLVKAEVEAHEEPAPPPPAPSCGAIVQLFVAPLPPP